MKKTYFLLLLVSVLLLSGCDYLQQFRETPLNIEDEPFISIIPEEDVIGEIEDDLDKATIKEVIDEVEDTDVIDDKDTEVSKDKEIKAKPSTKLEVNEGELVKIKLSATDPDGDPLTYTFTEPLDENGKWQTSSGDAGEYPVTITIDDGKSSVKQDILIVVIATNQPPVLELEVALTVDEGETVVLTPKVSDPDNDQVIITYSGWMSKSRYKTTFDDAGVYTVTVTASDGTSEVTQKVKVTVNDVNRPPVIESITLE